MFNTVLSYHFGNVNGIKISYSQHYQNLNPAEIVL